MASGQGDREYYTLVIIPPSGRRLRMIRFTARVLRFGVLVALCLLLATGAFAVSYWRLWSQSAELAYLRALTVQQSREIEFLAEQAYALKKEMVKIRQLEAQLRDMMQLEPEHVTAVGLERHGAVAAGVSPGRWEVSGASQLERPQVPEEIGQTLAQLSAELPFRQESLVRLRDLLAADEPHVATLPVLWPALGYVSSAFGYRRSPFTGRIEFHHGVDIAAPYGSPIIATGDGVVVFSGWYGLLGRTVIIDHGDGYTTVYGHNARNLVSVGDRVRRGQVIALVGASGRATGPHVHYEIRLHGKAVNPLRYMMKN